MEFSTNNGDNGDDSLFLLHPSPNNVPSNPMSIHPTSSPTPSKPDSSPRFLLLLLQAVVMAAGLFLFFLFAGIAALVLSSLFVSGRALRRRSRLHVHDAEDDGCPPGLTQEQLERLPSSRYSSGKGRQGTPLPWWSDCAVCLEGLRDGDRCRVLSGCGHAFHKACVDKWLVRSPACPVCRAGVSGDHGVRR